MCGIFGVVGRDAAPTACLVDRHTDVVSHRGPDGRGTVLRGCVGLGHRRLSIIDLSDDGRQPMWHATEAVCIVYNGEVYNYIELRGELEALGHRFKSRTDTEVILAAYVEWGTACVRRFNGMWAFAILDERRQLVFCSRDRFGVKPLFWFETQQLFAFGSELRQLLPLCDRRAAADLVLRDFLVSGLSDHEDATFFKGVMKLQAGHSLCYDLARHTFRIDRYYDLSPAEVGTADPLAVVDELRSVLTDAVRLRLRSDVRVGTCLSGGLDSSSIAIIAARMRDPTLEPFHAVTAISEQADNSEEAFARLVVEQAGLTWVRIRPGFEDFARTIDDVIDTQEEPFGGPSVCMQYFVMQAAKAAGIPVLLDGQGGDELLFGYERHYAAWLRDRLRSDGLRGMLSGMTDARARNANVSWTSLTGMLAGSFCPRIIERIMVPRMSGARFKPALPVAWKEYIERIRDPSALLRADVGKTSLPMLLRFEDRNSMRHSIEARLPFLDYRVVELALAIPLGTKMRAGWTKWPIRAAMHGSMPDDLVWRKNKIGFEAPDDAWLTRHRNAMEATVGASRLLAELFDRRWLDCADLRIDRRLVWRMYCLAAWERRMNVTDLA